MENWLLQKEKLILRIYCYKLVNHFRIRPHHHLLQRDSSFLQIHRFHPSLRPPFIASFPSFLQSLLTGSYKFPTPDHHLHFQTYIFPSLILSNTMVAPSISSAAAFQTVPSHRPWPNSRFLYRRWSFSSFMGDLRSWSLEQNGAVAEDKPSSSSFSSFSSLLPSNPTPIGVDYWRRAEEATQAIISQVQPTVVSERRRKAVIDYVQRLIRGRLRCEVSFGLYLISASQS